MTARFGFLRRVAALALCLGAMVLMGGQGAWANPNNPCVRAAAIVDALYSTGAGAGSNGIPSDYKPPCRLAVGRIIGIQASETEDYHDNSIKNKGGYVGCGQMTPQYHENPTYPRGSSTTLKIQGAGNEVQNLLRAGEYLCHIQSVLKTDRCDVVSAAYNAGEGAVQNGLDNSGGIQADIETIIKKISDKFASADKKQEMREYVGCTCGGPMYQKYTVVERPDRYCTPNGGGIGGIGNVATGVLIVDQIADVGTGVIQALASVVKTAVVLFDKHLGPALLSVVMVIYSIMALWAIAKLLMPFGRPGNAGQTMNGLLTLTGTVGIVALMLNNLSLLTSMVFFPIMSLMTELGDLSASSCQSASTLSTPCTAANAQSLSGDVAKDAKLLATRMTCTVDQAMQPLKQILRISMASLKRLEGDFQSPESSFVQSITDRLPGAKFSVLGLVGGKIDEAKKQSTQILVLASAVPLAVMSATSILGIVATTAQAFWKIAFEFFKLAPAVAAFAFRPTRGVFSTSVKGWISPIMIFAVIYSILGLSSSIVCNLPLGKTADGKNYTLGESGDAYVAGIPDAPVIGALPDLFQWKSGEALFPVLTKSVWITLAFFTIFINSSLRLAAKMDWVGGGGLADGLQKLVSNTLGNLDHYKALMQKTVGLASDVAQNAWMKSGDEKKKDKEDKKDDKKDDGKEGDKDSKPADGSSSEGGQSNADQSGGSQSAPSPQERTPV